MATCSYEVFCTEIWCSGRAQECINRRPANGFLDPNYPAIDAVSSDKGNGFMPNLLARDMGGGKRGKIVREIHLASPCIRSCFAEQRIRREIRDRMTSPVKNSFVQQYKPCLSSASQLLQDSSYPFGHGQLSPPCSLHTPKQFQLVRCERFLQQNPHSQSADGPFPTRMPWFASGERACSAILRGGKKNAAPCTGGEDMDFFLIDLWIAKLVNGNLAERIVAVRRQHAAAQSPVESVAAGLSLNPAPALLEAQDGERAEQTAARPAGVGQEHAARNLDVQLKQMRSKRWTSSPRPTGPSIPRRWNSQKDKDELLADSTSRRGTGSTCEPAPRSRARPPIRFIAADAEAVLVKGLSDLGFSVYFWKERQFPPNMNSLIISILLLE